MDAHNTFTQIGSEIDSSQFEQATGMLRICLNLRQTALEHLPLTS